MVNRVWGRLIGTLTALGLMAGAASAVTAPILVVDADSGKVLYSQGATAPWYPASITKLMTTYVALDMVRQVLKPGGNYVVKVFQGEGSDVFLKDVRTSFEKVSIRKPEASRPRSREVYLVGKGFKG